MIPDADVQPLLERAKRGDADALAMVCSECWPTVYGVLARAGLRREEAEELTQEAFARVLGRIDGYRPEQGSFDGYLVTVARNLLRDRWRAAPRVARPTSDLTHVADHHPGPEAEALAAADRAALTAALVQLPAEYQEVLRLRLLERRPAAEVAELFGRTPDAIRQLQRRALVALRWKLGKSPERNTHGA